MIKTEIMADEARPSAGDNLSLSGFHGSTNIPSDIEGDIHVPVKEDTDDEFNTLDEPVSHTLVCIIFTIRMIGLA